MQKIFFPLSKARFIDRDRIGEYLLKFSDAPVPVDVIVYTEQEIKEKEGNTFIEKACSGIKLW